MKPSEVCDHAAKLIEERGWTRNVHVTFDGALCLSGALRVAGGMPVNVGTNWYSEQYPTEFLYAYREVARFLPKPNVVRWNDYQAASAGQVIEVLRSAANRLRLRHELPEPEGR